MLAGQGRQQACWLSRGPLQTSLCTTLLSCPSVQLRSSLPLQRAPRELNAGETYPAYIHLLKISLRISVSVSLLNRHVTNLPLVRSQTNASVFTTVEPLTNPSPSHTDTESDRWQWTHQCAPGPTHDSGIILSCLSCAAGQSCLLVLLCHLTIHPSTNTPTFCSEATALM